MFDDPILFVGAHPDDIDINAGGTVSKLINLGKEIISVTMTNSSNNIRKKENFDSLFKLGISSENIIHLDFPDTKLFNCLNEMIYTLDDIIKQYKIKTLFTHFPYDTHIDHSSVSQSSISSGRLCDNIIFYRPTYPSGRTDLPFNHNLTINLTQKEIDNKVEALSLHISQIKKYGEEDYLEVIKDIARSDAWIYGGFHGYAELFQISRIKY